MPLIVRNTSYVAGHGDAYGRKDSNATDGRRTEAVWAEMQNTLEEVELSAAGGASAFSADHSRALEELRKSQISLAQAWARSEAEDDGAGETLGQGDEEKARGGLGSAQVFGSDRQRGKTDDKGRNRGESGDGVRTASLEEETNNDIQLARKRREANDQYFEKVNKSVMDVVEKLDLVAQKMKGVEEEAQDLWESRSSFASESPES